MSGAKRTVLRARHRPLQGDQRHLGHALGDLVLLEVARRLRELGDPVEIVARLGADEFAIVASSALRAGRRRCRWPPALLATLSPRRSTSAACDCGFARSVGVAEAAVDESGAEPWLCRPSLRRAEVAMYQAKAEHRGVRRYSDDLERSSLSRLALASELADAIDKGEFRLDYQPKVDAATKARHRRRGARALAAPDPWPAAPRRLHPPRRADRHDPRAHELGAATRPSPSAPAGTAPATSSPWR